MLPNILVPVERLSVGGYATGIRENTAFTLVFHNLNRRFIVAKKVEYRSVKTNSNAEVVSSMCQDNKSIWKWLDAQNSIDTDIFEGCGIKKNKINNENKTLK